MMSTHDSRCAVFAYHEVGYVCLETLLELGADVACVFTHEDDPNEEIWFRSVEDLARRHSVPVLSPRSPRDPAIEARLSSSEIDFLFSFHYRRLLPESLLRLARRGALNLHTSLLPKYRGRCPVNWVLVHGEGETGVTLHYMEATADSGDIVGQRRVKIGERETAATLYAKLTYEAGELLREIYPLLCAGTAPRVAQDDSQASFFGGRGPADGLIDWEQDARQIDNLIRAVTHPYPGAFTTFGGRKLYVWRAHPVASTGGDVAPGTVVQVQDHLVVATGNGDLVVECVQMEGGPELDGRAWALECCIEKGACLE